MIANRHFSAAQYAGGNPPHEDPDEGAGRSSGCDARSLDDEGNAVSEGGGAGGAASLGMTWVISTWSGALPV